MTRNWMRRLALPGLAAVLAVGACEKQVTAPATDGRVPGAASFAKGGGEHANAQRVGWRVTDRRTGRAYGLVTGRLPGGASSAERVIGPEGGWLGASGHHVYVSPGAVAGPTIFRIEQSRRVVDADSSVVVGVSLHAVVVDRRGGTVDVGSAGFAAPVYLYLDTSWAHEFDPTTTTILWLKSGSDAEPVAQVWQAESWYVARLDHFSDYGLGDPGIVSRTVSTAHGILR